MTTSHFLSVCLGIFESTVVSAIFGFYVVYDVNSVLKLVSTAGLIFGSDDFAANIGATRSPEADELLYARQNIIVHAKAFGLQAIDLVNINFKDIVRKPFLLHTPDPLPTQPTSFYTRSDKLCALGCGISRSTKRCNDGVHWQAMYTPKSN